MNRRTFLERLGTLPVLHALSPLLSRLAPAAAPFRRVRPSDPGWPSAEAWASLKERVGGRLIPVPPILAPCAGAPDSPACAARIEEMTNPYFIGEQPGGTQTSGWLDAWTAAPSAWAVAPKSAADVAVAVNFARDNRLRLVVKGGGHSYQGTSNAPDSLLVWTREMHAITLHDGFVPRGSNARPRPAVTVEAGARWLPTYDRVTTSAGRYVQGGGCATVGVAGLIQSGGFGSFSKNFGLAAAGLLEAEVVTADGRILVANAHQHPELFWGLKGGGGGSLGVVTKVTLVTHPLPRFFGWAEGKVQAKSDAAFRRLIREFLGFYRRSLLNPHWGEQAAFGADNSLSIRMVCSGLTTSEAQAAWKRFSDVVAASPDDFAFSEKLSVDTMPARHWWNPEWRRRNDPDSVVADPRPGAPIENVWWAGNSIEVNVFLYGYESIWLPEALLDPAERLADALFAATRRFDVGLHFNKGLAGAPSNRVAEARDTATNPAALGAFALAIIATGKPHSAPGMPGHEPDLVDGRKQAAAVAVAADALRAIVPDAGAYVSESNYFDRSFQRSYWGANYARLRAVKTQYDPDGLFFVHNGVGSEDWSPDGFTRLRDP
jgi:FAD/FMN-containing dehydrogenase